MAVTQIPIFSAPFQGGVVGANNQLIGTNVGATYAVGGSGVAIACTAEMEFVNDGYTGLFITPGTLSSGLTCTIKQQPDNATRSGNLVKICQPSKTVLMGPLKPIWFNFGGVVSLSFSAAASGAVGGATGVAAGRVSAVEMQF